MYTDRSAQRGAALFAIAAIFGLGTVGSNGQALTKLYGERPPAGSSFVRVVNPAAKAASVRIGDAAGESISATAIPATPYRIERSTNAIAITVNGDAPIETIHAKPDSFLTLVIDRSSGTLRVTKINDDAGEVDGLKAQLRFYNLVRSCAAGLRIEHGPTVFEGVATNGTTARAINPIAATLAPSCGAAAGRPFKLPQLHPGDRFSIFLTGDSAHPIAVGNLDATEQYHK